MKIEGGLTVATSPEKLWNFLHDPDFLAEVMPGCREFKQIDEDHFTGTVEAKVGAISSRYTTKFSIHDKKKPNSYRLRIEGNGKGGFIVADTRIRLLANPQGTGLQYDGEVTIGGTLSRVGQRLVDAAAKMLVNRGLKNLKKKIESRLAQ